MDTEASNKRCSFCGETGREEVGLAGGFGAWICRPCVEYRHEVFSSPERTRTAKEPPWLRMNNTEILSVIPRISQTAVQVDDFLVDWVAMARGRGISWAEIGKVMGVTRQAAWQRFAHRVEQAEALPEAGTGA